MNSDKDKTIYFITGASGVGKTTLLSQLQKKYEDKNWIFLHFDSIGVPSIEEMELKYGSPSGWQEANTYQWVYKLINEYHYEKVIFEGQVNLQFINDAFAKYNFHNYKTILIDCSAEDMAFRLTHKRMQPELVNEDMINWLKYLRNQAMEFNVPILDTSRLSEEEVIRELEMIVLKLISLE